MSEIKFRPIRGKEADILKVNPTEGALLIATDTGKMWTDTPTGRVALGGGSGAALLYGKASQDLKPDTDGYYTLKKTDLEESEMLPKRGDLIINSDGTFYRVLSISADGNSFLCAIIAVSGSGGGGGNTGLARAMKITGEDLLTNSLVNGQSASVEITAFSAVDSLGENKDKNLTINWALYEGDYDAGKRPYDNGIVGNKPVPSGSKQIFEFGTKLRESTASTLIFYATGVNSGKSDILTYSVTTVEMKLLSHTSFNSTTIYGSNLTMWCNIVGRISKLVRYYIDGELVGQEFCGPTITGARSLNVTGLSHGYHTARIELNQAVDEFTIGEGVEPIEFEIAVNAGNGATEPIIWLGDYADKYYNYDAIKIPFNVYNPTTGKTVVRFFKGITELSNSPREVKNNEAQQLQITDATLDITNVYYIRLDGYDTYREIKFSVEKDPNRDLSLVYPNNRVINFDAAGRSNDESATNRQNWSYTFGEGENAKTYKATFKDFNWHNNGWILDENDDTCLRISNGAEFSIPLGAMDMNTTADGKKSVSFEFEFKVRNVQDYSTLIKEITRYPSDTKYWNAFAFGTDETNEHPLPEDSILINPGYTSYDQYLAYVLPLDGKDYDSFTEIDVEKGLLPSVYKQINLNATFCRYYDETNKIGLCLGPQDGFFATGKNTLSVKYVEDQLANLTIIFNKDDNKIYMYLNGVLTGVANNTATSKITINSPSIVFNSEYCDLDLYKFRVYNCALSVADVDINYAVDHTDIEVYDHTTQLALYNTDLKEYQLDFNQMIAYNRDNPSATLMPYLVIETAAGDKLPYSKANKKTVSMTFVNTNLDRAFAKGELDDLVIAEGLCAADAAADVRAAAVANYYKHHCPSWTGSNIELSVQGTSSEFYPRRNYKAKTKDLNKNVNMYMNAGPYKDATSGNQLDFFYYDNDSVGTTKFTLKIDFMESSGTYNMGFANLVKTAYTKHPLNDYSDAGAIQEMDSATTQSTVATSFDPKADYYYFNHKGNLKRAKDELGKVTAENFAQGPNGMITEEKKKLTDSNSLYGNHYVTINHLGYKPKTLSKSFLNDLRTSVQGFPVLTYWKDADGKYTFIGRYNMLLDKGSDEAYGFALNGAVQGFVDKPGSAIGQKVSISDVAECWEFENNNRGYCSYRDPMGRNELSFETFVTDAQGNPTSTRVHASANKNAPVVVDSYEYRYHKDSDTLDYIMDPTKNASKKDKAEKAYPNLDFDDEPSVAQFVFEKYANWEKAVKWVWSTCIDKVPSMGTYVEADVAAAKYVADVYYVYNGSGYEKATGDFNKAETYFVKSTNEDKWTSIKLTDDESKVYVSGVYYIEINGIKVLDESGVFDASAKYFALDTSDESYKEQTQYLGDEGVTYKGKTYYYDTKEYRLAKFKNEFKDYFDLEYSLVYWVMTEVFLCYDSRGKNCMMASWGPLKEGGNFIWYPIFYDIDTQLGINNTGIPSYEYSVNASNEGCFSTSDSVLWQNLYTCFFADLKGKYHELKNNIANKNTGTNVTGPIYSVPHIEDWYLARQNSYAMKGARPLIALNMDEFYKYISICNPSIKYQDRQGGMSTDNGTYFYALQGDRSLSRQQFLARRINFLDSWLSDGDYSRSDGSDIHGRIAANNPSKNSDNWIEGNAANNAVDSSGNPINTNVSYYVYENGKLVTDERGYPKKTQYLDADIYVDMTPYQRSYVTLGDDNEAFDSKPYEGSPVKFDFPGTIANGIKTSGNYPEQLLYLYGASSLKDIGDISRLYWTEFYAVNSPHLSRLLLGSDAPGFYNKALKMPNFDADLTNNGKPLLKEVNLTNVTIDNGDSSVDFNFASSEKMEIFKAVGSNIESVEFAPGVALHTLYLPNTITELKLIEANNLKKMLTQYTQSTYNASTDVWTATPGLYIQGLTDLAPDAIETANSNINTIAINGGSLGYDSLKLLQILYRIKKKSAGDLKIEMTKVDWSPYQKLDEGFKYVSADKDKYFVDDGHYGFVPYDKDYDENTWKTDILNGEVYRLKDDISDKSLLVDVQMFKDFISEGNFMNLEDFNNEVPELSGEIYIDNSSSTSDAYKINESYIRNTLLEKFPNVNFHFATVTPAYSAKFILMNLGKNNEPDGTYTIVGTQKISTEEYNRGKTHFASPYYDAVNKTGYQVTRDNYDFWGWSTTNSADGVITQEDWNSDENKIKSDQIDYTFYAVFTRHRFEVIYNAGINAASMVTVKRDGALYGDLLSDPQIRPSADESKLGLTERYKFLGWTQDIKNVFYTPENAHKAKPLNITSILATQDFTFYAMFTTELVTDSVTDENLFKFEFTNYKDAYDSSLNIAANQCLALTGCVNPNSLSGKLTIPSYATKNGVMYPVTAIAMEAFANENGITHIFFENTEAHPCMIREFKNSSFSGCLNLKYIDLPSSLRVIYDYAFSSDYSLRLSDFDNGNLVYIGERAFQGALAPEEGEVDINIHLGGELRKLGARAFQNASAGYGTLTIGSETSPSQLQEAGNLTMDPPDPAIRHNGYNNLNSIVIYVGDRQSFFESEITYGPMRDGYPEAYSFMLDPNLGSDCIEFK